MHKEFKFTNKKGKKDMLVEFLRGCL